MCEKFKNLILKTAGIQIQGIEVLTRLWRVVLPKIWIDYLELLIFLDIDAAAAKYGEGNGNPLQYSCLENPRDGGTWWTAVYGIPQSQTQVKQHLSRFASIFPVLFSFVLFTQSSILATVSSTAFLRLFFLTKIPSVILFCDALLFSESQLWCHLFYHLLQHHFSFNDFCFSLYSITLTEATLLITSFCDLVFIWLFYNI